MRRFHRAAPPREPPRPEGRTSSAGPRAGRCRALSSLDSCDGGARHTGPRCVPSRGSLPSRQRALAVIAMRRHGSWQDSPQRPGPPALSNSMTRSRTTPLRQVLATIVFGALPFASCSASSRDPPAPLQAAASQLPSSNAPATSDASTDLRMLSALTRPNRSLLLCALLPSAPRGAA